MGRSSLLSLLLLALLVFGYGPRPSLAKCTPTNSTEVYEGEKVISAERPESGNKVDVTSFSVSPLSGFQSVNLTVTAEEEINGSKQTVQFSHLIEADDKCFEKDQWMKVWMWADLSKDHTLGFRVAECWQECRVDLGTATTGKLTLRWLNVTARGRSKWTKKLEIGGDCVIKQLGKVDRPSNVPNCTTKILQPFPSSTQTTLQLPSSSQPHISTSTQLFSLSRVEVAIVVVVSVVVVTGAMLVVIGVYVRKKRRRNVTVTDAAASSTHTVVRENSTYQAWNDQHAAVDDKASIIENEIFEPFSDGEGAAAGNRPNKPFSYTQTSVSGRKKIIFKNVNVGKMDEDTEDYIYEIL